MTKISDLPLGTLYLKPKITISIEEAIRSKETFDSIKPEYCQKVCKLNCKSFSSVELRFEPVDVLIIQDHDAPDERFKDGTKIERTHRKIIDELASRNLRGLTFRIHNLVKCKITKDDMTKGKPPTTIKQLKCSPYLLEEIRRINPRVIISLTSNVTKALGLKYSNYTNRGKIHVADNRHVILTLHPKVSLMIRQNSSGKMWGPDYWDVINKDFEKAGRICRGELVIPDLDSSINRLIPNIHIARSMDDVRKFVKILLSGGPKTVLSYDTETTGLDPWAVDAKLLTAQFGLKRGGTLVSYVFPLWHRENTYYNPDEAWQLIADILTDEIIPKIGHNIKFDVLYTYATTGVRIMNIIFDTMLVLHNINSGIQGNYGLKKAIWDWAPEMGIGGYEDKLPKLTKGKDLEEIDAEESTEV